MRSLIIAVAALAATGGPAMSEIKPHAPRQEGGWLTLQTPTTQDHTVFDGAVWRCKADICRSPQVKAMPPMRSCRRLVRELGPISSFGFRGVTFSEADLAACNGVLVAGR
ncbi:CC_3452 family protein [Caulobacter sp. DWP3-1-3b2]|uniref:CC_3452 family protein n=1 Tax=Caulobacter sp. DWP3-1-3b2 TaxID=2804643 RepID=UPI003CF514E2